MTTVNIRSIDALEELQTCLIRYADQTQAALNAIQGEVQRTLDWLDERVRHWQNEVQRLREEELRATAAYRRCMASGDRDHPPSCGREEQAVTEAHRRLKQAEAELNTATQARQAVQTEAASYQQESGRLRMFLQSDTAKAVETLRNKVTILRSYTSGASAGDVAAGVLAFGAGLAIGAALGAVVGHDKTSSDEPARDTTAAQPPLAFAEGSDPPIQLLHPEIRQVTMDLINFSDSPVHDDSDFRNASRTELIEILTKLQQVQRWIQQGATDQMLRDIDQERGLWNAQGYHNIYRIFYGDSPIALEKAGASYLVLNGYHRLAVAKELAWTTIPALVAG